MNIARQPIIAGIVLAGTMLIFHITGCVTPPPPKEKTPEELQAIQDSIQNENRQLLARLLSLGGEHYRQKNYDSALKFFRQVVTTDFGGLRDERLNRIYKFVGSCYMQKSPADIDSAIWAHQRGVEQVPDDPYNYEALVHLYKTQSNYDEAIDMASALTGLVPDKAAYWASLAELYMNANDCDEALASIRQALNLESNHVEYQQSLTDYMERCGIDLPELIAQFEKLIAQDPDNMQHRIDLARYYMEDMNYRKAADQLELVIADDPTNIPALQRLGDCYQEIGRYNNAIASYQKIININPEDKDNLCNLAISYASMGQYSTAMTQVRKAQTIDPGYGLTFITKGFVYENSADKCSASSDKISFSDKLVYEMAYNEYRKATQDVQYRNDANRRMAYVKPLLPTKSDRFMNKNQVRPEGPCYQWIP